MVTEKEQLDVLPTASVTKNVLVVVPNGNADPETRPAVCVVKAPEQLSAPIGAT